MHTKQLFFFFIAIVTVGYNATLPCHRNDTWIRAINRIIAAKLVVLIYYLFLRTTKRTTNEYCEFTCDPSRQETTRVQQRRSGVSHDFTISVFNTRNSIAVILLPWFTSLGLTVRKASNEKKNYL